MAADRRQDLLPTVRAAAALLTKALGRKIRIRRWRRFTARGRRNALIRCYLAPGDGVPGSVVVKKVLPRDGRKRLDNDARARLRQDWAGGALLDDLAPASGIAPRVLAGDLRRGFIVLEDLGATPKSLVRPLLGKDPKLAARALVDLARILGRLHATTVGRKAVYRRLVRAIDPAAAPSPPTHFEGAILRELRRVVELAPGLREEMRAVRRAVLYHPTAAALRHGDPCPDNVVLSGTAMVLHDFEFAGFGHPLMDAAYFRMIFPSCWCAGAVPSRVVAQAERAYRAEIAAAMPDLARPDGFRREIEIACARWVHIMLSWHLAKCLNGDVRWGLSMVRPRLLSRLQVFVDLVRQSKRLPAHRVTMERLLAALKRRWPDAGPLPLYPAFRRAA